MACASTLRASSREQLVRALQTVAQTLRDRARALFGTI
jgi:hypothetical protein